MPTPILRQSDNGVFYAFWSDKRRSRRKSMGSSDRAAAEARFAQWLLLGGHRGTTSEEGKSSLTVAELWDVYDKKHVQKETVSHKGNASVWKKLKIHFGDLTLEEIDEEVVEDFCVARATGVIGRPSRSVTIRKELVTLRACFNWHANPKRGKGRLVDHKDIPIYSLPEDAPPRDRWLRTEEIQALLTAAAAKRKKDGRVTRGERFLWVALETAARCTAILELTWDRVDFEIGVIHFADPNRKKTRKRRVSVPISKALMPILKRAYEQRTNNLVMDHTSPIWLTLQRIVQKAGLAPKTKRMESKSSGISPHTLRHTAATHMARRGVPLYDIAGILGNSLAMVEKVYAKHSPDRLRAAVNSISSGVLEPAE